MSFTILYDKLRNKIQYIFDFFRHMNDNLRASKDEKSSMIYNKSILLFLLFSLYYKIILKRTALFFHLIFLFLPAYL